MGEEKRGLTTGKTWVPEAQKACDEEREKNPPFQIEAYLHRSGKYKPLTEYIPFSCDDEDDDKEVVEQDVEEEAAGDIMSDDSDIDLTILPAPLPSSAIEPMPDAMDVDQKLRTSEPFSEVE